MSEWKWIDRREREPVFGERVVVRWPNGHTNAVEWTEFTAAAYWMPIPPPPPKMVTIEISEEAARFFANSAYGYGSWGAHVGAACRKALEGK